MAQPTSLRSARRTRRARPKAAPAPPKALFSPGGRAWINGAEVGGTDPRYAHLNRSYD